MGYFNYTRRKSSEVHIGNTPMGGDNPVRIQSMANVPTLDTDASVAQAIRIIDAGGEYVRFTAQGEREARNLGNIRKNLNELGYITPLIADIHFNPKVADIAAEYIEKVRINPGNYVDKVKTFDHLEYTDEEYAREIEKIRNRFIPFLNICKKHKTAIRIGVNHGSLSDRIMSRYGDTPEGMVASCMEFLRICKEEQFNDVVISIKASNTVVMVETVRLLVQTMDAEDMHYPLHLGVTEAGDGEDGRIKSAVGIGALLADGIGDTIRVSLSEEPENEIPVAKKLVNYICQREGHTPISGTLINGYDTIKLKRHITRTVGEIGGNFPPIVISDQEEGLFNIGDSSLQPDYIYTGKELPGFLPDNTRLLVDADTWKPQPNIFPYFRAADIEKLGKCNSPLKFVEASCEEITDRLIEILKNDPASVLILTSQHQNYPGSIRACIHRIISTGCNVPIVLKKEYSENDPEDLQIKAAADFGTILLDGFGNGLMLHNKSANHIPSDKYLFGILQATRTRISKTEYISCPSCGRTLYNLQETIAKIKKATQHLKGLKIGIMGCIVNGPGEMADADYGYVGAGRNRISLYKKKTCVLRNIPEEEAVSKLVQLIKENGDWND